MRVMEASAPAPLWTCEALELTLAELAALEAIYGEDFAIHTELTALKEGTALRVSSSLSLTVDDQIVQLHIQLPPTYPINSAAQAFVSVTGWTRRQEEQATNSLQEKAASLIGQEAIMALVYELQELVFQAAAKEVESADDELDLDLQRQSYSEPSQGRRWIWAHHITDSARRKSIVAEARDRGLGGYLKSGYPGIVVVEGFACNDFVSWIKGNKSRPGGFGRNWGHHVRGEVEIDKRKMPEQFAEPQNMHDLGALCREHGLEEEFLEFVMQHKVIKGSTKDDSV